MRNINTKKNNTIAKICGLSLALGSIVSAQNEIRYATEKVDDVDIFYREAGDSEKPTLVLSLIHI